MIAHLVTVINHDVLVQHRGCPADDPLKAAGVEVLQLLGVGRVVDCESKGGNCFLYLLEWHLWVMILLLNYSF